MDSYFWDGMLAVSSASLLPKEKINAIIDQDIP